MAHNGASHRLDLVGGEYRLGKKIGSGAFGVLPLPPSKVQSTQSLSPQVIFISESTSSRERKSLSNWNQSKSKTLNSSMNQKSTKLSPVVLVSLLSDGSVENAITMPWSSTSSALLSKTFSISAIASSVSRRFFYLQTSWFVLSPI
jgi:hypothetical protein